MSKHCLTYPPKVVVSEETISKHTLRTLQKKINNEREFDELKEEHKHQVDQLEYIEFWTLSGKRLPIPIQQARGTASVLLAVLRRGHEQIDLSTEEVASNYEISRKQIHEILHEYFWILIRSIFNISKTRMAGYPHMKFIHDASKKRDPLFVLLIKK